MRKVPIKRRIHIEFLGRDKAKFTTIHRQKVIDLSVLSEYTVLDLVDLKVKSTQKVLDKVGLIMDCRERREENSKGQFYTDRTYRVHAHQEEEGRWDYIGQCNIGEFTHYYTNKDTEVIKSNEGVYEVTVFESP